LTTPGGPPPPKRRSHQVQAPTHNKSLYQCQRSSTEALVPLSTAGLLTHPTVRAHDTPRLTQPSLRPPQVVVNVHRSRESRGHQHSFDPTVAQTTEVVNVHRLLGDRPRNGGNTSRNTRSTVAQTTKVVNVHRSSRVWCYMGRVYDSIGPTIKCDSGTRERRPPCKVFEPLSLSDGSWEQTHHSRGCSVRR